MDPFATRRVLLQFWPQAVGERRISPPELQAVEAVVQGMSEALIPRALRTLYQEPVTARALKWGDVTAVSQALRWRDWGQEPPLPDPLWQRKLEVARQMHEPVWIPAAAYDDPEELPSSVLTVDGVLAFEDEYLPRVVAGEHRDAAPEAKAALAIAARTFVLRAMRDHPTLARITPIKNGSSFQAFAKVATPECVAAVERTRGIVMRYQGRLIVANFVAGAPWYGEGQPGKDPTNTERWVTYNAGRSGAEVKPTALTLKTHLGNRGCMSQNGAQWLAEHGRDCWTILRYFYGEDVEFHRFEARKASGSALGLVGLAVVGLVATAK